MGKGDRHAAILRIVRTRKVRSQREIQERLQALGHEVTQPTLSRDCDELGLQKIRDERGRPRYAPPEVADESKRLERLALLLGEFVLSMVPSANLLVLRTPRGAAGPIACSIDGAPLPDVVATLAGEDTMLLVAREGVTGSDLERTLRRLIDRHATEGRVADLDAALADAHAMGHEADDLAALSGLRTFHRR